jgi:hypothetical protein
MQTHRLAAAVADAVIAPATVATIATIGTAAREVPHPAAVVTHTVIVAAVSVRAIAREMPNLATAVAIASTTVAVRAAAREMPRLAAVVTGAIIAGITFWAIAFNVSGFPAAMTSTLIISAAAVQPRAATPARRA